MGWGVGPRPRTLAVDEEITTAAGETTIATFYVEAGTRGLLFDTFHTTAASGTIVYKIYALPYTADHADWDQETERVLMLASASQSADAGSQLMIGPDVTVAANVAASRYLPYMVQVTATATTGTCNVFVSVTM